MVLRGITASARQLPIAEVWFGSKQAWENARLSAFLNFLPSSCGLSALRGDLEGYHGGKINGFEIVGGGCSRSGKACGSAIMASPAVLPSRR